MEKVIEISGSLGFSGEHKKVEIFHPVFFLRIHFLKKFLLCWANLKEKVLWLSKSIENDAPQ